MRYWSWFAVFTLFFVGIAPADTPPNTAFLGGRWFDGERFVATQFYSVDGTLTREKPNRIDREIDLGDWFVVPPFGEAHNHNIDERPMAERMARRYLQDGIFYVKIPNNVAEEVPKMEGIINSRRNIDVAFSHGALTAPGGHGIEIAKRNIDAGRWPARYGEGGFYHTLDSEADLLEKWPRVLVGKPDFIKTYLLYSEEFEKRREAEAFFGWKGLNPVLLPKIVELAHLDGLRVSTHVETATDFHHAVNAGVDEINHLPGFRPQPGVARERYSIAPEDAERAAERDIVVVTTANYARTPDAREIAKANLVLLKQHGVRLAVGSDRYAATATMEINYLSRLEIFEPVELLRMWTETTANTIFPNRRIGRLDEGYEASFLVLEGNPLEDFRNTRSIRIRVKQGFVLEEPE